MLAVIGEARAGDVEAGEDLRRRLVESEHDLDVAVGVLRYYRHGIAGANGTGEMVSIDRYQRRIEVKYVVSQRRLFLTVSSTAAIFLMASSGSSIPYMNKSISDAGASFSW